MKEDTHLYAEIESYERRRMKYEEFECIYQEYCLKILTFIHKKSS